MPGSPLISQRARFDLDHGDPDAALTGMTKAGELAEASDDQRLRGSAYELTGRVLFQRGEYEKSQHAYERYLEIAKELELSAAQTIATHYLGHLVAHPRRSDEALETLSEVDGDPQPWLRKAAEIYRVRGMLKYEAGALVRLIALAESRGDVAMVRLHLERLLEVYEASRHSDVASLRSRLADS